MMEKEVTFRPLKSHRKSRTGCQRCKARKIKCDERHPICVNCSRKFGSLSPCCWDFPAERSPSRTRSPSPYTNYLPVPVTSISPNRSMRTMELRLFHHYITLFAPSIPHYGRPEIDKLYSSDVPKIGFGYEAVLSATLAVAACHYLSLVPDDRSMKVAARHYLDQSVREQSSLVANLDGRTAEPAILASVLLFGIMKLRAAFVDEDEAYTLPFQFFHLPKGIDAIREKSKSFLSADSHVLVQLDVRPTIYDEDLLAGNNLPPAILQDSKMLLEDLDEACTFDEGQTYRGTMAYLHTIYLALLERESPAWTRFRFYAIPGTIPTGFLDLLEQEEPRAMAILARFMALMKLCDGPMYHPGIAEYEVHGIASLMPADWQWSMALPSMFLEVQTLADCAVELRDGCS